MLQAPIGSICLHNVVSPGLAAPFRSEKLVRSASRANWRYEAVPLSGLRTSWHVTAMNSRSICNSRSCACGQE
eukprot:2851145-Pleurochrysis_carterae.AAC.3